MTKKCKARMVQRELYNVRGLPNEGDKGTRILLKALFNRAR